MSLALTESGLWASGPEGLFLVENGVSQVILQPQEQLYCSHAIGNSVLVGGLPHGIGLSINNGMNWHAVSVDQIQEPVQCIAHDPHFIENGVMLAGTAGAGILRTDDRGWNWVTCNFGLENFNILNFFWSPPASVDVWPQWDVVFAATEDGLYRSPNGGLGWRRCLGTAGIFQTVVASQDFHQDNLVLAGTDGNGLWRSTDGGRHFEAVINSPRQVNALAKTSVDWLLSDETGIYRSANGLDWTQIPNANPALILLNDGDRVWAGTKEGVEFLSR